jgi:hypothetical protein
VNNASSTIEKIALAALQLSQGKSISAAKFLGEAAEATDILRAVKIILRASDSVSDAKALDAGCHNSASPTVKVASASVTEVEEPVDEGSPIDGFVSRYDVEQEMLNSAKEEEPEEILEEAETEEEEAAEEADDEDDEDASIEVIQARFAAALMNITAAAKKKKAKRKSSMSVKTGKKIKLTPRDI